MSTKLISSSLNFLLSLRKYSILFYEAHPPNHLPQYFLLLLLEENLEINRTKNFLPLPCGTVVSLFRTSKKLKKEGGNGENSRRLIKGEKRKKNSTTLRRTS